MDYAVLIDTGADWPDVIFVGGYERAQAILARVPEQHTGSVQAVVSLDDALAYGDGLE